MRASIARVENQIDKSQAMMRAKSHRGKSFEHYGLKNRSLDMIHRQERANMQISRLKWLLMPLAAIIFVTGIIAARQTRRVDDSALKNADKGTEWLTYGHT